MLPRILTKLFGHRATVPEVIPSPHRESLPASEPVVKGFWRDDSELRALAQDAKDNVTNWVMAHDLRELYANIETHNQECSAEDHIRVDIWSEASDKIAEWRGNDIHNPNKNGVYAKGTLVLKGEMLLKAFGPSVFEGLRLHMGNDVLQTTYVHGGSETYLIVEGDNVVQQKVYFKGGNFDDLSQASKPTLSLS